MIQAHVQVARQHGATVHTFEQVMHPLNQSGSCWEVQQLQLDHSDNQAAAAVRSALLLATGLKAPLRRWGVMGIARLLYRCILT
jgi:hypothetical protein